MNIIIALLFVTIGSGYAYAQGMTWSPYEAEVDCPHTNDFAPCQCVEPVCGAYFVWLPNTSGAVTCRVTFGCRKLVPHYDEEGRQTGVVQYLWSCYGSGTPEGRWESRCSEEPRNAKFTGQVLRGQLINTTYKLVYCGPSWDPTECVTSTRTFTLALPYDTCELKVCQ